MVSAPHPVSGTARTAASAQGRRLLTVMPDRRRRAMLAESRTGPITASVTQRSRLGGTRPHRQQQEAGMEHADWLDAGYDTAQARFLMMTAITHHRFTSPCWGADEIRSLHAELREIDASAAAHRAVGMAGPGSFLTTGPDDRAGRLHRRPPAGLPASRQRGWPSAGQTLPSPSASVRKRRPG